MVLESIISFIFISLIGYISYQVKERDKEICQLIKSIDELCTISIEYWCCDGRIVEKEEIIKYNIRKIFEKYQKLNIKQIDMRNLNRHITNGLFESNDRIADKMRSNKITKITLTTVSQLEKSRPNTILKFIEQFILTIFLFFK
jgi:hypothetical protein